MAKSYFNRKKRSPRGTTVKHLMGQSTVIGQVGLEIECEGNKFKKDGLPPPWTYHHDGSLRGADNAEYVLARPIAFEDVPRALTILWDMFNSFGSILDNSNRTSVHVHVNVQNFHMNRLASFLALYFSVEDLLTTWCGENRVGNLFCLRAKDATAIIEYATQLLINECDTALPNGLHYSGLNIGAIQKLGSVEIRTLRGVSNPSTILTWVQVIERLYNLSEEIKDPREVTTMFSSSGGPMEYLSYVLGDKYSDIISPLNMDENQIRSSLYEGIRLAQEICYCRDWSKYETVECKEDPFGRPSRRAAPTLETISHFLNQVSLSHTTPIPSPSQSISFDHTISWSQAVPDLTTEDSEDGDYYEPEYDELEFDEDDTE